MTKQENLELQIKTYDANYRAGTPIATDEVYDQLLDQLKSEFPDSDLLKRGVIKTSKQSRKQQLPLPMFSLNKCKSLIEIQQWSKSKGLKHDTLLIITPKFDGISLVVNEKTKQCWTRGDGEVGQVSTDHFEYLGGYGENEPYEWFSFGEAIMPKKNFETYRDKYANPRNLVAGLFNRDESTPILKDVHYLRYGCNSESLNKSSQLIMMNDNLNEVKIQFRGYFLEHITEEILDQLYKYWSTDYQIDGLVIDVEDSILRRQLGREENMNPAYAIAYKNPEWSGSAIVKVTGVTWEVSKQGKLKPVIQIEPTEVSGVVISNVTGYNAKYIFDNCIAEDSIIKIIRSGDVIPKHIETINSDNSLINDLADEITECPCCHQPTKWDETFTELICTNPECEDQKIMKLVHFFNVLEIEDFGEPSIRRFYRAGYKTVESILKIDSFQMTSIDGFGPTSMKILKAQFEKLRTIGVPLAKLIHSMDVMQGKIGEKTIQLIFDNLPKNDVPFLTTSISNLIKIDGIAEIIANVYREGISNYLESVNNLYDLVTFTYIKTPKQEITGDKFKDQKLCFTGCRPSKEQQSEIESQGGEIVSGVSSKTTILVVKDKSDKTLSSSKAQKAKELGVKIIEINKL